MVEEKQNKESQSVPGEGWGDLAVEEEELDVGIPADDVKGVGTLKEKLALSPNLSDMQAAMVRLFPEDFWGEASRLYELLMVGRISPDVFEILLRILVKEAYKSADPTKPFSVGKTLASVYTILSIGLDGKGRIDALELAGAAREESELKAFGGGWL